MILDATSGNRRMWEWKDSKHIVYIDIQVELEVPPTLFASNEQTPFRDNSFDTIFYDPPHAWGEKGHFYTYPRRSEEYYKKWKDKSIPRYYGWERYKNRRQLSRHIYDAQKEFNRILKDGGLLWLKWNEIKIPLKNILSMFTEWDTILKLPICSPKQRAGKQQTYWVCMQKKKELKTQQLLLPFPFNY